MVMLRHTRIDSLSSFTCKVLKVTQRFTVDRWQNYNSSMNTCVLVYVKYVSLVWRKHIIPTNLIRESESLPDVPLGELDTWPIIDQAQLAKFLPASFDGNEDLEASLPSKTTQEVARALYLSYRNIGNALGW